MKKSIRKAFSILAVLAVSVLSLNFGVGVLDGGLPQPLPKVSADASGNAVFSFPIEVFPGTKGVDPELGVSYSSAAGDGDFGAGWNLSGIGRITRSPVGMKYTADDAFISSVSGKLVRTGTSPNGFYYRNDPDAHFLYEYNVNKNLWSAKDSAGNNYLFNEVSYFGSSVKSWFLTEFRDSSGNFWKVSYSDRSRLDEDDVRISSIVYADRTVTFTYADSSVYSTLFTYGNAERDRSLISSIKVQAGSRYREYTFTYETGEFGKERLRKIGRKENTGNGDAVFRDLELTYNADRTLDLEQQRDYRINNTYAFSQIPFQDKTQCVSGELACKQAGVTCAPGAGYPACASAKAQNAAKCTTYKQRWQAICWFGLPSPNHTLQSGDIEGDGKPELLRIVGGEKQNNLTIVALKNLDGTMKEETVSPQFGGLAYRGFNTMSFADADGDGRVDFAYSNSDSLQIMYGNGTGFSAPVTASVSGGQSVKVPLPTPLYFTDVPDTGWKGGFVDINGDGKADYVRVIDADKIGIFLSKGRTFDPEIIADIKGVFIQEGQIQQPPMFLDMDGDGKPEMVYLTESFFTVKKFNANYNGIVNGAALAYGAVPDFGDPRNRFISDLNGDGKPDIIAVRDTTYDVFYFTGYDFVKKVYNKPASVKRSVDDPFSAGYVNLSKSFADVNGDGHPDLINFDGTEIQVFLYSRVSMGFEDNPVLRKSASSFLYAMDVNRDGRADLISLKADKDSLLQNTPIYGTAVSFKAKRMEMKSERLSREAANASSLVAAGGYLSLLTMNPVFIAAAAINSYIATQKAIRAMDRADLFSFLKFILDSLIVPEASTLSVTSFTPQKKGNLLIGTSDGYRKSETVEYGETKDMPGTYLAGSGNGQILPNPSNSTLTVKIITNYGDGSSDYDAFEYQDARILTGLPDDRADLGWRKMTVSSFPEGTKTETLNFQSSRDLAGKTERHTEFNSAGQISSDVSVLYVTRLTGAGTRLTLPSSKTEQKFRNGSLFKTVNSSISYDAYGNPTGTVISSDGHTEETSVTYINDWTFDTYTEGLPETSVKKINGAVQEEKSFTYDSKRRPSTVTLFPSSSPRTVSTSYDSKGQPSLITDTLGYTVSHIYGQSVGNCLSESKNPLGHVSRTVCNEENGTEVQMTDANGAVTQKLYDEYGRHNGTVLPGNSQTSEEISYEFTQSPFGHAVRKRIRDDANGWIESAEFFDAKGRSVRKESPGFGGMKFVELTEYDSAGRAARKSDSFLEGSESPLYSVYTYNADNETVSVNLPDGGRADSSISLSGTNIISSSTIYSPSNAQIRFTETETDAHGKTVRKTADGKTITYAYDALGRMTDIFDPSNGKTSVSYNQFGNRTSQTDRNSGTTSFNYDTAGRLTTQTDARGMTVSFDYDALGRVTAQRGSDGTKTEYTYDETLKGKLSRVTDATGTADYSYDIRGNSIERKKKIDEYTFVFRNEYDSLSRVTNMTYPDGTKANYRYSPNGQLSEITMDAADGTSHGNTVVSYELRGTGSSGSGVQSSVQFVRRAGNGTEMTVSYDRIYRRPVSLMTKLSGGHIEQSVGYSYDEKGNMTNLTDNIISNRTQTFEYDIMNRLTKAFGKYGTETYGYTDNGNMTKRGSTNLTYGDANHIHAVTQSLTEPGNMMNYAYDASGNMTDRNGDVLKYDASGRMIEMNTVSGDKAEYSYDSSGKRVRKKITSSSGTVSQTVYNIEDAYEITKEPGKPEKHTLYFKGAKGDLVAQMTREDAVLVGSSEFGVRSPGGKRMSGAWGSEFGVQGISRDKEISFDKDIQRTGSVAEGYGAGKKDLYGYPELSERGSLWTYISDETCRSFHTCEYSGGLVKDSERIHSVSEDSQRFSVGIGNLSDTVKGTRIYDGDSGFGKRMYEHRPNAELADSKSDKEASEVLKGFRKSADAFFSGNIFFADCSGVSVSCKEYRENRIIYSIKRIALFVLHPKNRELRDAFLWSGVMVLVLLILGFGAQGLEFGGFELQTPSSKLRAPLAGMLLVSILFQFTSCVGKRSSKDGTPPWILMQSGVSGDTVSISEPGYVPGGSSGFGAQGSVRGMFFLHQDHLGSVTMVTDGAGNVVSGGSMGGKANYLYKPYGEIDRMNSSGPDITKFKYTGQEEDKESGLYYYKARYYDASLGRFNSADSLIMPESIQGMNRYMYVEGNPVKYNDPTGHKLSSGQSWGLFAYFVGQQYNLSYEAMAGIAIGGRHKEKKKHKKSVEKNFLNNVGFAFDPGYRIYKAGQYLSGVGGKDKLDSRYKSAALGYMLNGQEGAVWGYLYGRSADKKKDMHRRYDRALAIKYIINIAIIVASAGLGASGAEADTAGKGIVQVLKNFGVKDALTGGLLGGVIDFGLGEQIEAYSQQMAGYDEDTALNANKINNMCTFAFAQHSLNIRDKYSEITDFTCATGIYPF